MELVILDRVDFSVKDNIRVASEFEIVFDLVVTQRSIFKTEKRDLNIKIGDYLYIKKDGFYFGVVESITKENNYQMIACLDFKEIFKVEVIALSYDGNLADYIEGLIRSTFIINDDNNQNLSYLEISKETSKVGKLTFEDDKIMTIYEILELITKMYGVSTRIKVTFDNGSFLSLQIRIVQISSGAKIKADTLFLEDLKVNESSKEQVNKVIFHPMKDNLFFKDKKTYYLLTDGTISEEVSSSLRYEKVISKVQTYSDNDYLDILDKVKSILMISKEDHQITFTISKDTTLEVLKNLEIGDFIEFIYKGKIYDSVVTGIKYVNNTNVAAITLGEYRVNLTEKLQILTKGVNSNIGNVTINNQGYSDLDGGEF